jgi:hypothetical protein
VLERYIQYIAGRVDGLGGDSAGIAPSPTGVPYKNGTGATKHEYTGRVCEVLFDCFGDFEGFLLIDCRGTHGFKTRERGIRDVVLRACKDWLLVTVQVDGGHRIRQLIVRC